MTTINKSKNGIDRLVKILKDKPETITRAIFWKIPHDTPQEDIALKIGRYRRNDILEVANPKSELTLDNDEFNALISFLSENYEPFKKGAKKYIPLNEDFDDKNIEDLRAIFDSPNKQQVLDFVLNHSILPDYLVIGVQHQMRTAAVRKFKEMLDSDLLENDWQKWFKNNNWVLGTEFVKILDEREIDSGNITDYLAQAYDGFLDIIEIKRPEGGLKFWMEEQDHGNYIPSTDLTKAITQASKYIHEVEREADSIKFLDKVEQVKTIKPRCVLIFGRSNTWNQEQKEAFRILNSSYHNLTIMTYDHVLGRAERVLGLKEVVGTPPVFEEMEGPF